MIKKVNLGINTAFDLEDTNDLNQSEKNNLNQNISDSVYNLFTEENLENAFLLFDKEKNGFIL